MNTIIIPAYNPDKKLIDLIQDLKRESFSSIVVINDGSDSLKDSIFKEAKELGCILLYHKQNCGKGAAIKTGIQYISTHLQHQNGFITCDADGQHQAKDIARVSDMLDSNPGSIILGQRDFNNENVPKKSRFGNRFSAFYFKQRTHVKIQDTQTGLRGISKDLIPFALSIKENRYDYEMNFLLEAAQNNIPIIEIPISTIYLDENSSSHFRPIVDSIRIYKRPIKFGISSLLSAALDLTIFTILTFYFDNTIAIVVLLSTLIARLSSGVFNFILNRIWSFRNLDSIKHQFIRYFILYLVQLSLSILFVTILAFLPIHLTVIKIFVDSTLFIGSYFIQKNWVFKRQDPKQNHIPLTRISCQDSR